MIMYYCLFSEEAGKEIREVDTPVFPDVPLGRLLVYVFIAFFVKKLAILLVGGIQEILVANGYVV